MKKFLVQIILLGCISIISIMVIDGYILLTPILQSRNLHERNFMLSYSRLRKLADTNKIVIIAGSNGGFSINSNILQQTFNLPVVNTSTHAGIGIRLQFEAYKDYLKKGDIVVFCPEYGGDIGRLYGGSTTLRIISSHLPCAYLKVSIPQWIYLHKYIGVHLKEIQSNYTETEIEPQYSIKALNKYGDIECNRPHKDSISSGYICGDMDLRLVKYIQYIHDYTKEKNVHLVFLPPTLMKSSFDKNYKQIDSIHSCLKCNGIDWHAEPLRYCFPDTLYYDTEYHMTQEGANLRTKLLVEDMKRVLN